MAPVVEVLLLHSGDWFYALVSAIGYGEMHFKFFTSYYDD
jgi:hypothetical protein